MDKLLLVAGKKIVLSLFAADNELEVGSRSNVPAHLQQHDIVHLVFARAASLPQVDQFARIGLVSQEAATAGRGGVVLKTEFFCQLHLGFAISAGETVKLLPIDPALSLRQCGRKVFGTQRPQQPILGAGFTRHHRHGVLALGHGALANHLTGDNEIEAVLLRPLLCLVHHEDLAVQAGVHVRAVAVLRVQQHILVFFHDIDNVQLDPKLLGRPQGVVSLGFGLILLANGMGVSFHAKAGKKIDAFHMDPLFKDHLGGKHGIKTAGDQGDGFTLLGHGRESNCYKGRILRQYRLPDQSQTKKCSITTNRHLW